MGRVESHLLKDNILLLGEQAGNRPVTRECRACLRAEGRRRQTLSPTSQEGSLHSLRPRAPVLFNIDAKDGDKSSRERGSAMIEVFYKVYLLEARGLYSKKDLGSTR